MLSRRCVNRLLSQRPIAAISRRQYSDSSPAASSSHFSPSLTPGTVKPTSETNISWSSVAAGTRLDNINYFKNKSDPVALDDSEYPEWLRKVLDNDQKAACDTIEETGDLYSKSKKSRALAKKRAAKLAALEASNPEKKVPINEQTVDLPFATVSNPKYGPSTVAPLRKVVATVGNVWQQPAAKSGMKGKTKPTTVEIGGDAEIQVTEKEAALARAEVKKAMRSKGRAAIKEGNFLAQM